MKIICGTDFSTHASEAANAAAALTARLHGTLSLVHVMDISRYELPSKELMDYLCGSRQAKLKKEAERLRRQGATVEEQFLQGSPAVSQDKAATDSGARLIVVSSLGQIAPSRWFVGSVAGRYVFLRDSRTHPPRGRRRAIHRPQACWPRPWPCHPCRRQGTRHWQRRASR